MTIASHPKISFSDARHKYVRYINVFLYIWIIITMIISVLDLALGILFAIDYDTVVVSGR